MSIESELKRAIINGYDIEIKYVKYGGETSHRKISNISYDNEYGDYGYNNNHIKGYCHLRNENRSFRISRISAIRVLPNGTWVRRQTSSTNSRTQSHDSSPIPIILNTHNTSFHSSNTPRTQRNLQTSTSSSKASSSEGCYIATMAYGSYDHPQVKILRWYRDNILKQSFGGRFFIRFYYYISPKLVTLLDGHHFINRFIRLTLDKFVIRIRMNNNL